MVGLIIAWSLRHRLLVLAVLVAVSAAGIVASGRLALDAMPDLTETQVDRGDHERQGDQVPEDPLRLQCEREAGHGQKATAAADSCPTRRAPIRASGR